jgi:hypothetical protein
VVPRHKSYPGNTLLMALDGVDRSDVSLTSAIAFSASKAARDGPRPVWILVQMKVGVKDGCRG